MMAGLCHEFRFLASHPITEGFHRLLIAVTVGFSIDQMNAPLYAVGNIHVVRNGYPCGLLLSNSQSAEFFCRGHF